MRSANPASPTCSSTTSSGDAAAGRARDHPPLCGASFRVGGFIVHVILCSAVVVLPNMRTVPFTSSLSCTRTRTYPRTTRAYL